jgi:hypothetical protein
MLSMFDGLIDLSVKHYRRVSIDYVVCTHEIAVSACWETLVSLLSEFTV